MKGMNRIGRSIANWMMLVALGAVATLAIASFILVKNATDSSVAVLRKTLFADFDKSAKFQVEAAATILKGLHKRQQAGELKPEEAKRLGADLIRSISYGGDGYLFVDTFEGMNVVNQGRASEGNSRWEAKDKKGNFFIQELIRVARQPNGGYSEYWFPKPGQEAALAKRSYSLAFEPFGWVIGTGNYVDDLEAMVATEEQNAQAILKNGLIVTAAIVLASVLVSLLLALRIGRSIAGPLEAAILRLEEEAAQAANSSETVASASQELAQSTNEQASAMQETAASVAEMYAIIQKNAENAGSSGKTAQASVLSARRGKEASEQMLNAIHGIERSNSDIVSQIDQGNRDLTEITKVIAEIASKTKVIHDIVFQTKLLSFNASVEAARAGDAGKGFAVVAEEVGKLAQMSGAAAKEIGDMLAESSRKVEQIVQGTRSKVDGLIKQSTASVAQGIEMASQGSQVLDEILKRVAQVESMVSDIAVASREQEQGVAEITKAMEQLDQTTHHNNDVSQTIAGAAERLSGQACALGGVVEELKMMIGSSTRDQRTQVSIEQEPEATILPQAA